MTKVVINTDFGGFGLSKKALILLGYTDLMDFKFADEPMVRHDPRLVEVVEKLGDEASGKFSCLEVVEIEGNQYRICEYDGCEWVETPDTIEWTIV